MALRGRQANGGSEARGFLCTGYAVVVQAFFVGEYDAATELAGLVVLITITLCLNGLLAGQGGIAPARTARAAPLSG